MKDAGGDESFRRNVSERPTLSRNAFRQLLVGACHVPCSRCLRHPRPRRVYQGDNLRGRGELATKCAASLVINARTVPGSRLNALLLLAGRESLWRTTDSGADLPEAAAGRRLLWATSLPSFAVKVSGD